MCDANTPDENQPNAQSSQMPQTAAELEEQCCAFFTARRSKENAEPKESKVDSGCLRVEVESADSTKKVQQQQKIEESVRTARSKISLVNKEMKDDHSTASQSFDPESPNIKLLHGRWAIETAIGSGGFGSIYRAFDTDTETTVALKMINTGNRRAANRLRYEYACMRDIQNESPHMPRVFALVEERQICVMAMQLLDRSIADLRRAAPGRRFSTCCTLRVTRQVAEALRLSHDHGVLHRDVKPSNMSPGLRETGLHKIIYLYDYGLARRYKSMRTGRFNNKRSFVGFRGTTRYASVRAQQREDQGPADDVRSLFYAMIEMANGQLPWRLLRSTKEVLAMKQGIPITDLISGLPTCLLQIDEHLDSITAQQEVDFSLVDRTLVQALVDVGDVTAREFSPSAGVDFDWKCTAPVIFDDSNNNTDMMPKKTE